jgi:hypothetical protein
VAGLAGGSTLVITPATPLAAGAYTATLGQALTDLAGNHLPVPLVWSFEVYDVANDSDGDCLPDDVEIALGLDPSLADSDRSGTPDGDEDSDGDGLLNCREILLGTDPGSSDTDSDLLGDGAEVALGSDPLRNDTDHDGFLDGEEVQSGSSATNPGSIPAATTAGFSQAAIPPTAIHNEAPPPALPHTQVVTPAVSVQNESLPPPIPHTTIFAPVVGVENEHVTEPPPP